MNYKLMQDPELYFSLYEKVKNEDNLDKAAEYLLEATRLSRDLSYRVELASLYLEMDQIDMSISECFSILSKEKNNTECLSLLSTNFAEKKNYRAAYYYFTKYDKSGIEDISEIMSYDTDLSEINKIGFKLVWNKGIKDCSEIKEEVEMYVAMKDYKQAIKSLNHIPKNSEQYDWARKMLVYCHYMNEDYQSALDVTEEVLKKSSGDISMLAVAYNILVETGDTDKATIYANLIVGLECADVNDAMKAGYCLMDSKRYVEAVTLLRREQNNYPYHDGLLLLLASAEQMAGKVDKAKNILLRLINMYGDRTYAKFYLESINLGEECNGGIAYAIPSLRALKNNVVIENNLASDIKFKKEFLYNSKFKSILKWRIQADSEDDYSKMLIAEIGILNNGAAIKFLEELLINEKIAGEAKIVALYYVLVNGLRRSIPIVYDSYLRTINMVKAKETTRYLVEGYAICAIHLAPMMKDYEDSILKSFNKLKDKVNGMRSPDALAALILYYADDLTMNDETVVTELFGANLKTFRKYIKILESNI